jgi:ribosomal protein S18 acetylase RimI-like enzyme
MFATRAIQIEKSLSTSLSIASVMEVIVEPAKETDISRLEEIYSAEELHRSHTQARWYVRSHFDYNSILVAKVDGRIQGACFWRIEGEKVCGTGWIEDMWVEKGFRKLGLGERLLRRAVADLNDHFSKDGLILRKIFLTTNVTNKAARALYEKLGFVKCGEVDSMYEDGILTLIYGRDMRENPA